MISDSGEFAQQSDELTLRARSTHHGRVYQQGRGNQFVVEKAYFGTAQSPDDARSAEFIWPKVRDLTPLQLGVHRASLDAGNAVPEYIERDFEYQLRSYLAKAIEDGGMVLVVGDSTTGKSRSAYEAMNMMAPDHRLFAPSTAVEFRGSLMSVVSSGDPFIIWLDNLERFVGPEGLTSSIFSRLQANGITILSTIRSERYRKLTQVPDDGWAIDASGRLHDHTAIVEAQFLEQVDPIIIPRLWTIAEIERAKSSLDERVRDALEHKGSYGIAEYLAAGPKLLTEWRLAWAVEGNPRGAAMVAAAIDLGRAGLDKAVPEKLIEVTHEVYLRDEGGHLLRPESFTQGLAWALTRRYGVTSIFMPTASGNKAYHVFDYLQDFVARDPKAHSVPSHIWEAVLSYQEISASDLFEVGYAAISQSNEAVAERAWKQLSDGGDSFAMRALGRLYVRQGREAEAIQLLRQAAEVGNNDAAVDLGVQLQMHGKIREAEFLFKKAAKAGDSHAAFHLAELLQMAGRNAEAKTWLAQAAAEDRDLTDLEIALNEVRNPIETERRLKREIAEGDLGQLVYLGIFYAYANRNTEAEEAWREAFAAGHVVAANNLGLFFARQNKWPQAQEFWRLAAEQGSSSASSRLAGLLAGQGHIDEAKVLWEQAAAGNSPTAFYHLGVLANGRGNLEEAESWWRKGIDAGNKESATALGETLIQGNRFAEARSSLEVAAEANDPIAMCSLGKLLYTLGELDSYQLWLRRAIDHGHAHAACFLASTLEDRHMYDEVEDLYIKAFEAGHRHAAEMLELFYAKSGQGRKAAYWHRIVKERRTAQAGGSYKQASRDKQKKRRRRK